MNLKQLLSFPLVYELFTNLVGGKVLEEFAKKYVRPEPGNKILDIGCGPGLILKSFPKVDYIGFDLSEMYIQAAQNNFGNRGKFFCKRVTVDAVVDLQCDIVIASGVLHHLNDQECRDLFDLAYSSLKPAGRLVTHDGCFAPGQSMLSRFVVSKDRGRFVRKPEQYLELARKNFTSINSCVRHDMVRIPYAHFIMECTK